MDRNKLRQMLAEHFNDSELGALCFELEIDYENVPGRTKDEKIRELIAYCDRHDRLPDLIDRCRRVRPKAAWPAESAEEALPEPLLPEEQAGTPRTSLWWALSFNLVLWSALAFFIRNRFQDLSPCVLPAARALSLTFIAMLLVHLAWRRLSPTIKALGGQLRIGPVTVSPRQLALIVDAVHPHQLSGRLWLALAILFLAAGLFSLSPLSPFHPSEATPIIQSFSVRFADGTSLSLPPGEMLELGRDEQVLVEMTLLDPSDTLLCKWSTINGVQNPGRGCSTVYSLPPAGERDSLSVRVITPCRTQQTTAGIHVVRRPSSP